MVGRERCCAEVNISKGSSLMALNGVAMLRQKDMLNKDLQYTP
jgi:hypothetical protein